MPEPGARGCVPRGSEQEKQVAARQPISTAPTDGSKVTVYWTDGDGVTNESIAHYRSPDRLKAAGGDWDANDAGWWTSIDSHTQKKIEPTSWRPVSADDEEE